MIIRRRHTKNFTTINNVLFEEGNGLKADEVGILGYLLSRPDNWEVRRPALQRRWGIGPVAMKRIVRSWMRAGWCAATKIRLPNGTFCILYDISDIPGPGMSEAEITEALSLVSSEASGDEATFGPETEEEPPHISDGPPPCQPVVAGHPVVTRGVAYIEDITNTDLTNPESQNSERELARAREKHALGLAEFKRRWPTAASDDQGKIDEEWFKLELDQGDPAIAGITPFLEKLKRDKRTTVPAAWKYLKERRWTLLEQASAVNATSGCYARDSEEAKAISALFNLAGALEFFVKYVRKGEQVYYRHALTPQLMALAAAPTRDQWVQLNRNQAGAWESFMRQHQTIERRVHLREGLFAPWPWPPSADGKLYTTATGPPETYMSEEDQNHI